MWGRLRTLSRATSRSRSRKGGRDESVGEGSVADSDVEDRIEEQKVSSEGSDASAGQQPIAQIKSGAVKSQKKSKDKKLTDKNATRGRLPPQAPGSSIQGSEQAQLQSSDRSRSRSRSFGSLFRRKKDLSKDAGDLDSLASSLDSLASNDGAGSEASVGSSSSTTKDKAKRSRSLSNPLRLIRRSTSKSSTKSEKSTGSMSRKFPSLKRTNNNNNKKKKKNNNNNKQADDDYDDDNEERHMQVDSVQGDDASVGANDSGSKKNKKVKKLRIAKKTKRIVRRLSFRLGNFNNVNSKQQAARKSRSPKGPLPSQMDIGSPRAKALEEASFPHRHHFSRADVLYFKSIHASTTTTFETLSDLIGEGVNDLLLAKLAQMVEDQDDLFRALAILRSTDAGERAMMLFHMHNLSDNARGITREDLASVLRLTVHLDVAAQELPTPDVLADKEEAEEEERRAEKAVGLAMMHRIRLERFYSMHSPHMLVRIGTILEKYDGQEARLWRKLEKQYDGARKPSACEIQHVLDALEGIQALVNKAFGADEGKNHLGYREFCAWASEMDASFAGDAEMRLQPWRELYRPAEQGLGELAGWLRVATLEDRPLAHSGKTRISELSWRRRWCEITTQPDGTTAVEISKARGEAVIQTLRLDQDEAQVDTVERPTHKHRWTALVNRKFLLQPSQASSQSFEDWLAALRLATHNSEMAQQDEYFSDTSGAYDDESDEEALATTPASAADNVSSFGSRIKAFYIQNNPDKLETLAKTLQKYKSKENKLESMLQKRYPSSNMPTYVQAKLIIDQYEKPNSPTTSVSETTGWGSYLDNESVGQSQSDVFENSKFLDDENVDGSGQALRGDDDNNDDDDDDDEDQSQSDEEELLEDGDVYHGGPNDKTTKSAPGQSGVVDSELEDDDDDDDDESYESESPSESELDAQNNFQSPRSSQGEMLDDDDDYDDDYDE